MKSRPIKTGTEVRIHWDDACSRTGWVAEDDDDILLMTYPARSLGFVLNSDKRYLRLTMSAATPNDAKSMRGDALAVPWSCITKLEKL